MSDQALIDMPDGFTPWGPILRARWYSVVTSNAVAIYHGVIVEYVGNTLVTPTMGSLPAVIPEEHGAVLTLVGVVIGIADHNFQPMLYMPVTTIGNAVIAGYVLVADHPDQVFVAQEDGDTSSIIAANIGLAADCIGVGGSTTTGRSAMEIDSNTIAATSTFALKVIGVHPEDTMNVGAAAGTNCRFLVTINSHIYGPNTSGA